MIVVTYLDLFLQGAAQGQISASGQEEGTAGEGTSAVINKVSDSLL